MSHVLAAAHNALAPHEGKLLETQVALAEIAAPSGEEGDRAHWVANRFERLGLSNVEIDTAGNVIGRRNSRRDAPAIAVCAHLDTVFPRGTPHSITQSGRRYFGPSITDNSRGVAGMLTIIAALRDAQWEGERPIEFVGTTGEEGLGDLRGAKHYFATRGAATQAAIIIDGAGDERIVHRALGSRRYRATFDGPGGHSWSAFGAPNAVHAAAAAATAIAAIPLPRSPRTTITVARMGGGLSVNAIPQHAWIEIDVRSSSAPVLATLGARIAAIVRQATIAENQRSAPGMAPLRSSLAGIGDRPCGEVSESDPLVQTAMEFTRLAGRQPELAMSSTDANVPISLGIPAIAIGAGGKGGDTHTTAEWFEDIEGMRGVARAMAILLSVAAKAA